MPLRLMHPRVTSVLVFVFALLGSASCIAQAAPLRPRENWLGPVPTYRSTPSFALSPGNWSQLDKLVVKGYINGFGQSVGVSGQTVVTGTYPIRSQGAYVFQGSASGWNSSLPIAMLALPASSGGYVTFVAIDGDTIVVGSPGYESAPGYAYVYVKPPTGWADMFPTATLSPFGGNDQNFGLTVAISGNTIVVGDGTFSTLGAAYVFVKPSGGWTNMTQTAKLTGSDSMIGDEFGTAVSISGPTVVVGAPTFSGNTGNAYVFVEPAGGWVDMTQTAELTGSGAADGANIGTSVSVDGNNILVGAPGGSNPLDAAGKVYVFTKPAGGWTNMTQTAELTPIDSHFFNSFGNAVSLSGRIAAIGSPNRGALPNSAEGGIYIFEEPASGWQNITGNTVLTNSDNHHFAAFGGAVSASGKVVVGGSLFSLVAAYVFGLP